MFLFPSLIELSQEIFSFPLKAVIVCFVNVITENMMLPSHLWFFAPHSILMPCSQVLFLLDILQTSCPKPVHLQSHTQPILLVSCYLEQKYCISLRSAIPNISSLIFHSSGTLLFEHYSWSYFCAFNFLGSLKALERQWRPSLLYSFLLF